MAWAVFQRTFNYDFRPERAVCREIRPSPLPIQQPERIIAAAVAAGAAVRVASPNAAGKRAYKRAKRATVPEKGHEPTTSTRMEIDNGTGDDCEIRGTDP